MLLNNIEGIEWTINTLDRAFDYGKYVFKSIGNSNITLGCEFKVRLGL